MNCALDRNPHLSQSAKELPYDWKYGEGRDNWPATRDSRCERYEANDGYIHLDVDGDNYPDEFELDAEAVYTIEEHFGWREE